MRDFQVPVMAVFTKFDQFKRDIKMRLEDEGRNTDTDLKDEVENVFKHHYLDRLAGSPPFIRLESGYFIHRQSDPFLFSFSRNEQAWPTGCRSH